MAAGLAFATMGGPMRLARLAALAILILAFLAAPLAAEAQTAKVARVGYLGISAFTPTEPTDAGLLRGLREQGYTEGQNLAIEFRASQGRNEAYPALAAELVRLNVDVIVAHSAPAALAAKQATPTIPIVLVNVADPVGVGLGRQLGAPGRERHGSVEPGRRLHREALTGQGGGATARSGGRHHNTDESGPRPPREGPRSSGLRAWH